MLHLGDENPNQLDGDDFILGHFKDTISYRPQIKSEGSPYQPRRISWFMITSPFRLTHELNDLVDIYFRGFFSKQYKIWLVVSNIFLFSHLFGEMIHFDEHIFQMGWQKTTK